MYKKVYVEITNNCNLNCDFCIKNQRQRKIMTTDEFLMILEKLKNYTKYLYFHVLGEPLTHPNINNFIDLACRNYFINITTNGYLVNRISDNLNIRQVNISLHSYDERYKISLLQYMNNIFKTIDQLKEKTFFSLRIWVKNKYTQQIIEFINKRYNIKLNLSRISNNMTLEKNVYLSISEEFIWPDLENDYFDENGSCYALKHHIGILVDGTIVPCCLDSKGIINLGNIFTDNLEDIINSDRYKMMLNGFRENRKRELLCKKCPVKRNLKNLNM